MDRSPPASKAGSSNRKPHLARKNADDEYFVIPDHGFHSIDSEEDYNGEGSDAEDESDDDDSMDVSEQGEVGSNPDDDDLDLFDWASEAIRPGKKM